MVKYEIRKVLGSKAIILLVIIMLVLNIVQIMYKIYPENHGSLYEGKQKILNKIEGYITQDKYNFLVNGYNDTQQKVDQGDYETDKLDKSTYSGYVFGDNQIFSELLEDYKNCINYHDNIDNIIQIANENIKLTNNDEWKKYNNNLLKIYTTRNLSCYYDYTLMSDYINHEFSFLLTLVVVMMISITIFLKESQDGTMIYFKVIRNGRKRIFWPKVFTLIIFSFGISILFSIENYIIYYFLGANKGLLQPIYALAQFKLSTSSISILAYLIINGMMQALGCILFSLQISAISRFLRYSYQGIVIGLMILIVSIFSYNLNIFSVISFSSISELFVGNLGMSTHIIKGVACFCILIIINYRIFVSRRFL